MNPHSQHEKAPNGWREYLQVAIDSVAKAATAAVAARFTIAAIEAGGISTDKPDVVADYYMTITQRIGDKPID